MSKNLSYNPEQFVRMNLKFSLPLHKKFRKLLKEEGLTMQRKIITFIEEYVKNAK